MKIKIFFKRFLWFLFFLVLISGIGIGVYAYLNQESIVDIITGSDKNETLEVYNGIYSYTEKLSQSYNVYSGCNVYALYNYVVIIDDIYKYYDSSCMATTFVKEGKTVDLDLAYNESTGYTFVLDDKTFVKTDKVNEIVEMNNLNTRLSKMTLETIDFVIAETEKEGYYYSFNVGILGSSKKYTFDFSYDEKNNNFTISLIGQSDSVLYKKVITYLNNRPAFYLVNDKIGIIDKTLVGTKYNYNLLLYDIDGEVYNLYKQLPLKVNNVILSTVNELYIEKSSDEVNTFKILFGYENTFCNESKTSGISFYEFKVKYDYAKNSFITPDFVKSGLYSDGCSYIKSNYFKEG